ncbi:protein of unknown function [Paraburkholderia dioscoreae]|uniref:Uncharacterized protein n=1 Tax=Paraburkholderia dioscoreae TaxID=2604047 RepID=A0A5Q4ZC14_9BURK|nr:protein of unknown function [Paraburkholderia dioscoreae]
MFVNVCAQSHPTLCYRYKTIVKLEKHGASHDFFLCIAGPDH